MIRTALHVLLRSAVLIALSVAFQQGVISASDDPLGQGLAAFFAIAVVSGVLGAVDGWSFTVGRICVIWVVTGLLLNLGIGLGNQWPGPLDAEIVLSDLLSGALLIVGLVAGPAIFMGAMVAQVRPPRPALPR